MASYETYDRTISSHKLKAMFAVTGYISRYHQNLSMDVIQLIFLFYFVDYIQALLQPIVTNDDDPMDEQQLIMAKLKLCSHPLLTTNEALSYPQYNKAINAKTEYLVDITKQISPQIFRTIDDLQQLLDIISVHIFRPFPTIFILDFIPPSESDLSLFIDPSNNYETDQYCYNWIHLQFMYEWLGKIFSNNFDKKLIKQLLRNNHGIFIKKFIYQFASPFAKERYYIKTIIHRLYGMIMAFRSFIRLHMGYYVLSVIENENISPQPLDHFQQETYKHCGLIDILEIYESIFRGWSLPIMSYNDEIVITIIIPLHKSNKLYLFHDQLTKSCEALVEKDKRFALCILAGLLKYWPRCDATKQMLFIEEINVIMAAWSRSESVEMIKGSGIFLLIVDKLIECLKSKHIVGVVEKALLVINHYCDTLPVMEVFEARGIRKTLRDLDALLEIESHWWLRDAVQKVLKRFADNNDNDQIKII